jgi:hypothetical protein
LRGAQIKTPIEFVAGLNRLFGATTGNPQDWVDKMDQPVMDPPNVSGWPGYRSWISTNTYPVRRRYASDLIKTLTDAQAVAFIKLFDDYTDVRKLVKNVSVLIFPVAISQTRLDYYMGSLLQGAPDYDWPAILQNPTSAGSKIRNMLTTMSKAPDFQLC